MEQFGPCKNSTRVLDAGKSLWDCKELAYTLVIMLIAAACFLPALGSFGMLDPTDSFFLEAAREMIEQHHYITALYNYTDWLDKPILAFLPVILACKLFGLNIWAARLPAALSGIALVLATYTFTIPLLGRRAAVFSALILCSSPLFLLTGHIALSDELLSMLFGVAMLYAGTSLSTPKQKINIIAYVFLALAILTKGPIPLILAFCAIVFYLLVTCSSSSVAIKKLWQLRPVLGAISLLVLCLPYFYLAHASTGGAFTAQFFMRQNLGRMLGTVNHQEPIWFYLPITFAGYFPWIFYALMGFAWLKRLLTRRCRLTQRQGFIIFCFCWLSCVLLLFTFIPTKLPTYILPLSPALAILVGTYLDMLIRLAKDCPNRWLSSPTSIIIFSIPPALICAGSLLAWWLLPKLLAVKMSWSGLLGLAGTLMLVPCWLFWRKKFTQAVWSLVITSVCICSILLPCSFLYFYQIQQIGINKLVAIAKNKDASLATLFSGIPSAVFSMQKPVPEIKSLSDLEQFCHRGKTPHLLLATKNCLNIPQLQAKQHIIASDNKWYLLNVDGYPW